MEWIWNTTVSNSTMGFWKLSLIIYTQAPVSKWDIRRSTIFQHFNDRLKLDILQRGVLMLGKYQGSRKIIMVFRATFASTLLLLLPLIYNACSTKSDTVPEPVPLGQVDRQVDSCENLTNFQSGDYSFEIESNGHTRNFNIHIPSNYDSTKRYPLVLSFHGGRGDSESQASISKIRAKADKEGFISVEPNGLGKSWNAGVCCDYAYENGIDDVSFVNTLLDHLGKNYCIDNTKVFATGFSNGARMVHRLGCELAQRFAAIAPISAPITNLDPLTSEDAFECKPARPIPIFQFHGMLDSCNPFVGGTTGGGTVQERHNISIPDTIAGWRTANTCSDRKEVIKLNERMSCDVYSDCAKGASVTLCTHLDAGHVWPNGQPYNYWNSCGGNWVTDIDLTDLIWDFFINRSQL